MKKIIRYNYGKAPCRLMLFILCNALLASCSAQNKNDSDYILVMEKTSLKTFVTKNYSIEALRQFNPQIKNDNVKKGDTIFLVVRVAPEKDPDANQPGGKDPDGTKQTNGEPEKEATYSEQAIGKTGLLKRVVYNGKRYIICEVNTHKFKIELYNKQKSGDVYDLETLASENKNQLIFLMNGGMFLPDFNPVGLFISGGKALSPINLNKGGKGNFYDLLPNGVFLIDNKDNPVLVTSEKYLQGDYEAKAATQSGPMLVVNGVINSHFTKGSTNLNIRNGVGINKKGNVLFIISEDPVNFFDMSVLLRDKLECGDALYLDGFISQYYAPELGPVPAQTHQMAVFIVAAKRTTNAMPPDQAKPPGKQKEKTKQDQPKP